LERKKMEEAQMFLLTPYVRTLVLHGKVLERVALARYAATSVPAVRRIQITYRRRIPVYANAGVRSNMAINLDGLAIIKSF
jgi:hypothetical protein